MGKTILVTRFSALGDVALTVPVLKQVIAANPDVCFIMVSDLKWANLFEGIDGLVFQGFDLKKEYKGFWGIVKMFQFLRKKYTIDAVADLHAALRTHVLRTLFFFSKKKVAFIFKGRLEKASITRKEHKIYRPLPHTTERYLNVFEKIGVAVNRQHAADTRIAMKKNVGIPKKIGFAPFAKHDLKMYPLDKMLKVIHHFDRDGVELYFFGGGVVEKIFIEEWNKKFKHAVPLPASADLKKELEIMSTLDFMVTMDSANMHLASLVNVPVVSIWGPTHPFLGFYGYQQDPLLAVQENIECRPCSVFGNTSCWRGDHACMRSITVEKVISKIESSIS